MLENHENADSFFAHLVTTKASDYRTRDLIIKGIDKFLFIEEKIPSILINARS